MQNLTTIWLAIRTDDGDTRADALRLLNAATQCAYTNSRLNEWLRGDRQPDRRARTAMLQMALPSILRKYGITLRPDEYSDLAETLA